MITTNLDELFNEEKPAKVDFIHICAECGKRGKTQDGFWYEFDYERKWFCSKNCFSRFRIEKMYRRSYIKRSRKN